MPNYPPLCSEGVRPEIETERSILFHCVTLLGQKESSSDENVNSQATIKSLRREHLELFVDESHALYFTLPQLCTGTEMAIFHSATQLILQSQYILLAPPKATPSNHSPSQMPEYVSEKE